MVVITNQKTNEDASSAFVGNILIFSILNSSTLIFFGCYQSKNKRGCERSEHPSSAFVGNILIFSILISSTLIFFWLLLIKKQTSFAFFGNMIIFSIFDSSTLIFFVRFLWIHANVFQLLNLHLKYYWLLLIKKQTRMRAKRASEFR